MPSAGQSNNHVVLWLNLLLRTRKDDNAVVCDTNAVAADILSQHSTKDQLVNCLLEYANPAFKASRISRHFLWIS